MTWDTYLLYLATVGVFFATPPGSSQILMMSNSLRHGLRPSLATAAGDLSANAVQMLAAGIGLTALIASSAGALTVIKWLGVAYLLWFGLRTFFAPAPSLDAPAVPPGRRRLFGQGFVTSAANPEAVFFFAALFPQFLDPAVPLAPQLAVLGATYLVVDGAILVAMGAGATRLLSGLRHRARLLNRVAGAMMIAAAGLLGLKDVHAR
ncbi:LysE family translocator [Rhodobacteraceae bacterium CCMM004]|nr:LysE family translocator [Rhodobacteraceae bacterium CCMM004]